MDGSENRTPGNPIHWMVNAKRKIRKTKGRKGWVGSSERATKKQKKTQSESESEGGRTVCSDACSKRSTARSNKFASSGGLCSVFNFSSQLSSSLSMSYSHASFSSISSARRIHSFRTSPIRALHYNSKPLHLCWSWILQARHVCFYLPVNRLWLRAQGRLTGTNIYNYAS